MAGKTRDSNGKFVKSSPYGNKNLGIRLLKKDELTLLEIAKQRDITPTELGRIAITEWLANTREKSS